MKKKQPILEKEELTIIMQKKLGEVDCFCYEETVAGFAINKYLTQVEDDLAVPSLLITSCTEFDSNDINELEKSQMWDCQKDKDRVLKECKYQVLATNILGGILSAHDRADMLMDFMEALIEIYPDCEAIYFQNSGKMFLTEQIRNHQIPRKMRFIHFAVNVRMFQIQNSDDVVIDTIGMEILSLPDLQYYFHDLNPSLVVNHAYDTLLYIFSNDNPIQQGDSIDSIFDKHLKVQVRWQCYYENSLIQPEREVIHISMGKYAAGEPRE